MFPVGRLMAYSRTANEAESNLSEHLRPADERVLAWEKTGTDATPHPGLHGQSLLDAIPPELIIDALKRLAPHEQVGFSLASSRAASFSDTVLAGSIPTPLIPKVTLAATWMNRFYTFANREQQSLRIVLRYSPSLSVFSLASHTPQMSVFGVLASAGMYAERGDLHGMERQLCSTRLRANLYELPVPDFEKMEAMADIKYVERSGDQIRVNDALYQAMNCAFDGDKEGAAQHIAAAQRIAAQAFLDEPDVSEIARIAGL